MFEWYTSVVIKRTVMHSYLIVRDMIVWLKSVFQS